MRIKKAAFKNAETISNIVCLCYEQFEITDGYAKDIIADLKNIRGSTKCINELIENENMFIAADKSIIKGMISIKTNEITKLYIDPLYQKQGIGQMLFEHAESLVINQGYDIIFLGAATQTPIPFYIKMGMKITERRKITHGPCSGMTVTILEKHLNHK